MGSIFNKSKEWSAQQFSWAIKIDSLSRNFLNVWSPKEASYNLKLFGLWQKSYNTIKFNQKIWRNFARSVRSGCWRIKFHYG